MRFTDFAEQDPDALAVIDPQEREWSRREVASMVNGLSRACRHAGLCEGDVIAIAAPNCCEFLMTYLAAMQIGLHVVPLNWHLAPGELAYIVENSGAKALFGHERLSQLLVDTLQRCACGPAILFAKGLVPGFTEMQEFVAGLSASPLADPVAGRMLAYTSATTGRPRGVKLSLENAAQAVDKAIDRRVKEGTLPDRHVQLCASMLYHGAPLETVAASMHTGNPVVLADSVGPERWLQLIEKYRVTLCYVVPTMFNRLLNLSEAVRSKYSTASLTHVIHAGAPCPMDIKKRMFDWLGPILWEAYGATEAAGTIVGPHDWLRYPGTVGKPMPGARLKILNDKGEELPPGEVGLIYLTRYAGDRFEYLGDPEKTRACYRGDFVSVGDVGFVNAEGFLFISDRQIDMIIRSGMKVYPAEIENVLQKHPKVLDCAIIGAPDPICGEAIIALVQPGRNVQPGRELSIELLRFIGQHLSLAKVPQHVVFTEALPRTATGKLQKRLLREQFAKPEALRPLDFAH